MVLRQAAGETTDFVYTVVTIWKGQWLLWMDLTISHLKLMMNVITHMQCAHSLCFVRRWTLKKFCNPPKVRKDISYGLHWTRKPWLQVPSILHCIAFIKALKGLSLDGSKICWINKCKFSLFIHSIFWNK